MLSTLGFTKIYSTAIVAPAAIAAAVMKNGGLTQRFSSLAALLWNEQLIPERLNH